MDITSKEIIKQIIVKLEDELQHYTMVDIDRVKAKYIEFEIKDYKQVLQDLERLEVLEKENEEHFEIITKQAYLLNNKHIDRPFIEILQQENEKLKKAIKILKKYYKFKLFPPAMDNIPEISISTDWEHYISQQEYELLKEVLGDAEVVINNE